MRRTALLPAFVLAAATLVAAQSATPRPAGATASESKPAKPAAAPVSSEYELHGFFGAGDDLEVSVRRIGETQSRWLRVGVKSGDTLVEKADAKTGTATIVVAGRRHTLRLAAAASAAPEAEPEKAAPAEDAREARRARFRAMAQNATPEQMAAFRKVMTERMQEAQKANPELFNGRLPANEDARRQMGAIFGPVVREAAEAAAALPGKDGKITPLPADFDTLVTESMNDAGRRRQQLRPDSAAPAEGAATPPATHPAP